MVWRLANISQTLNKFIPAFQPHIYFWNINIIKFTEPENLLIAWRGRFL